MESVKKCIQYGEHKYTGLDGIIDRGEGHSRPYFMHSILSAKKYDLDIICKIRKLLGSTLASNEKKHY